jgi:hypothetical protein
MKRGLGVFLVKMHVKCPQMKNPLLYTMWNGTGKTPNPRRMRTRDHEFSVDISNDDLFSGRLIALEKSLP